MAFKGVQHSARKVRRLLGGKLRNGGKSFNLHVTVQRQHPNSIYAQTGQYRADVCPGKVTTTKRCGYAAARTPTAAVKKALRQLASKLK